MKRLIFSIVVLSSILLSTSQVTAQDVLDGIYRPEHTLERKVIAYAPLREADIMWLQRVW